MTYHLRMINMERMLYNKFSKILEKAIQEWEKDESYVKIRPLYGKLERIWKRIEFSKEKIDEVFEMKKMMDSFDDIQMNDIEKEKEENESDKEMGINE